MNFQSGVKPEFLQGSKEYFSILTDIIRDVCDIRGGYEH